MAEQVHPLLGRIHSTPVHGSPNVRSQVSRASSVSEIVRGGPLEERQSPVFVCENDLVRDGRAKRAG